MWRPGGSAGTPELSGVAEMVPLIVLNNRCWQTSNKLAKDLEGEKGVVSRGHQI